MPILNNARWERFAQELAKGSSQTDAYNTAGYVVTSAKSAHEAASRLARNVKVRARVAELKERSARRTELTIDTVAKRLVRIADKGEAKNDAPGLSVARLAMMDVAKLQGWLRERHELTGKDGGPIKWDLSTLSDEQLEQLHTLVVILQGGNEEQAAEKRETAGLTRH